jgi:hypothetical protein
MDSSWPFVTRTQSCWREVTPDILFFSCMIRIWNHSGRSYLPLKPSDRDPSTRASKSSFPWHYLSWCFEELSSPHLLTENVLPSKQN